MDADSSVRASEAILRRKRDLATQAPLVATVSKGIPQLVDHMMAERSP